MDKKYKKLNGGDTLFVKNKEYRYNIYSSRDIPNLEAASEKTLWRHYRDCSQSGVVVDREDRARECRESIERLIKRRSHV